METNTTLSKMKKRELISLVEEYETEISDLKQKNLVIKQNMNNDTDFRIKYLMKRLMVIYNPTMRKMYAERLKYLTT